MNGYEATIEGSVTSDVGTIALDGTVEGGFTGAGSEGIYFDGSADLGLTLDGEVATGRVIGLAEMQ